MTATRGTPTRRPCRSRPAVRDPCAGAFDRAREERDARFPMSEPSRRRAAVRGKGSRCRTHRVAPARRRSPEGPARRRRSGGVCTHRSTRTRSTMPRRGGSTGRSVRMAPLRRTNGVGVAPVDPHVVPPCAAASAEGRPHKYVAATSPVPGERARSRALSAPPHEARQRGDCARAPAGRVALVDCSSLSPLDTPPSVRIGARTSLCGRQPRAERHGSCPLRCLIRGHASELVLLGSTGSGVCTTR
jgi:hypothetical protein